MLGPKVERLPDDHPSKPECTFQLSRLCESTGNYTECKQLLIYALKLWRERGNDYQVARTLGCLSDANRMLGLNEEGMRRVEEGLKIYERLGDTAGQAGCLKDLAFLLHDDNQLDAAEQAASRAIDLLPEKGEQFLACRCRRILSDICHTKGQKEKAIHHS